MTTSFLVKKALPVFIQILLGAMFIFSGIIKLYPVEPFEVSFVDLGVANWTMAPFMARTIITIEVLIGLSLLFHTLKKLTLYSTIGLLVFFTCYLLVLLVKQGNVDNCGCFGTFLEMTPIESIGKNIVFLGMSFYLLKTGLELNHFLVKPLVGLNILTALAIPYILNVPDVIYGVPAEPNIFVGNRLEIEKIGDYNFSGKKPDLSKGIHVVAFMSLDCSHCKLAALKLNTIRKTTTLPPINVVFMGEAKDTATFFKETNGRFDHFIYNGKHFIKLSGFNLPSIYVLENGIIRKKIRYQLMDENSFKLQ